MRREVRNNLLFLGAFLAICAPGAVLLFQKKLDPAARPMYLPDPVRRDMLYMDPAPAPAEIERIVPPRTAQWVRALTRSRLGADAADVAQMPASPAPVMSERRTLQVAAVRSAAERLDVWLIAWDHRAEGFGGWAQAGDRSAEGVVDYVQRVDVPAEVRQELQAHGYPRPPAQVLWIKSHYAIRPIDRPLTLHLIYSDGRQPVRDRVDLPPSRIPDRG